MSEKIMDYMEEYLAGEWVENDPKLIQEFMAYCRDPERAWDFESGENGYFGYTAYVSDGYNPFGDYRFEFAYSKDFVKVFTANHNGYWVPEYINLSGSEALDLLAILKEKLLCNAGF